MSLHRPLSAAARRAVAFAARAKPVAGEPPAAGAVPRLLIVDDEWLVAAALQAVLADAGFAIVATAGNAADAVRLARQHRPDLVLMDVDLRGAGNGIDAAIEIRRDLGIRSLFLTGRCDEATRRRAAAADPAGWLVKPCVGAGLIETVREVLAASPASDAASG